MTPSGTDQFVALVRDAIEGSHLIKLTLAKPSDNGPEAARNLFVRPVLLKSGPRYAFVWRHPTKDVTKNHTAEEAKSQLERLIGSDFLDAHLFTASNSAQLETGPGKSRLRTSSLSAPSPKISGNDRLKHRAIEATAPWLRALGVTARDGRPTAAMSDKFRQIENFADILGHLVEGVNFPSNRPIRVFDMGCGKGYLTFATADLLGARADVVGVEVRPQLVDLCNSIATKENMASRLTFRVGTIADTTVDDADILVALHACDTATDDALAKGIAAGASLIVAAPCCQKELRPMLVHPPVLSHALRHGIFEERQAEFVTDALRALLLEWAGYKTRVIEFISTEHTAKNLMITAVKGAKKGDAGTADKIREFASFYGIRRQALAEHIGFKLA